MPGSAATLSLRVWPAHSVGHIAEAGNSSAAQLLMPTGPAGIWYVECPKVFPTSNCKSSCCMAQDPPQTAQQEKETILLPAHLSLSGRWSHWWPCRCWAPRTAAPAGQAASSRWRPGAPGRPQSGSWRLRTWRTSWQGCWPAHLHHRACSCLGGSHALLHSYCIVTVTYKGEGGAGTGAAIIGRSKAEGTVEAGVVHPLGPVHTLYAGEGPIASTAGASSHSRCSTEQRAQGLSPQPCTTRVPAGGSPHLRSSARRAGQT